MRPGSGKMRMVGMIRLRDVALVVSLFGALPVQAGTSIAISQGPDIAARSLAAAPLIADFRWGAPKMGAVPHLPVPPPHRMRAEDAPDGGDDSRHPE